MTDQAERFTLLHGTAEASPELRELHARDLSALLDGSSLRYVRLGGTGFLRRVYVAIRDSEWRTVLPRSSRVAVRESETGFRVAYDAHYVSDDLELASHGTIACEDGRRLEFVFEAEAARDFHYSRIGICLHHPWRETAGARFTARTPSGELHGRLPDLIGPQLYLDGSFQPLFAAFDRLEIELENSGALTFEFEGDLWETEDQRNWTDANFKTYSTPLALGPPPPLRAGRTLRQRIVMDAGALALPAPADSRTPRIAVLAPLGTRMPAVGLGCDRDRHRLDEREGALLRELSARHVRVDVRLDRADWPEALAAAQDTADRLDAPLELAVMPAEECSAQLDDLARAIETGPPVARVLVTVAGAGPRAPEQTTPVHLVELVREGLARAAPDAAFVGGTEMHYAELNRVRPEPATWDGVCYSITPQMHAFGDVNIVESLEAQAETVRSARALGDGKPVAVSPITLAPRSSFYADDPDGAEAQAGLPLSVNVRQPSLLGAAWTAGSVKHVAEAGADSVTYYETTGWRGVVERAARAPLPEQFFSQPHAPFPLYHVLSDACEWTGLDVLECRSTEPLAAVGLAVRRGDGRTHTLLANLTPRPLTVLVEGLAGRARVRSLDESSAALAARDVRAFRRGGRVVEMGDPQSLELAPYAVIRIDVEPAKA